MNFKQSILANFFKNKKVNDSEPESSSDDDSIYLPSKSKRMFDKPTYWTRVKNVNLAVNQRLTIFDVEQDILTDKTLRQVRKDSVRESSALLFDPESFKGIESELTIDS